jgi:type IV pilus assembly protein PilP
MRCRPSVIALAMALSLPLAAPATAQTATATQAAAAPVTVAQAATAAAGVPTASTPQGYAYSPAGRRDPFVPLMRRGTDPRSATMPRPEGLPGVAVSEVAIKGIVQSRGSYVAMLQAPDSKTYIVRNGDRLFDATVKAVTADAVVFVQQVNDPLSLVKQREIRRPLRPIEEGK